MTRRTTKNTKNFYLQWVSKLVLLRFRSLRTIKSTLRCGSRKTNLTPSLQRNFGSVLGILFLFLFLNQSVLALDLEETNYFASLKANTTNVRSGPGSNYPIKFTYNMRYLPVRVVAKYDNWHEIEDFEGERGWVNQNLLSGRRTVMVRTAKTYINMYSAATSRSRILLKLENKVVGKLIGCKKEWCKIEVNNKKGWIEKIDVWAA